MTIQLNKRWRVVESTFDPPQWMLQMSRKRGAAVTWESQSWCQTRQGLLTAITKKVIRAAEFYSGATSMPVEDKALNAVRNLPARLAERVSTPGGARVPADERNAPAGQEMT